MFNLPILLLLLPILGCFFVMTARKDAENAYHISLLTVGSGIFVILRLFAELNLQQTERQFIHRLDWLSESNIYLSFGFDTFSLMLLFGVYVAFLIGLVGLQKNSRKNKSLLAWGLYFLWNMTCFLSANDMISFYIFFAAMPVPIFMLVGNFGNIKKSVNLYLFFIFNFAAILIFLCALLIVYKFYHGNLPLQEIALINMPKHAAEIVWSGVCLSLLARIPIWPFHYWISALASNIKNPLVYIITCLLPLSGLYGFMRFWQVTIAESVRPYVWGLVIFCLITIIFITLIGIAHKDFLYKLFAYMTIYYLLFLLAEVLLSFVLLADTLQMNIAYSLFIFLLVTSSLIVFDLRMEQECIDKKCDYRGILAHMPKRAKIFTLFILVALGLPISSMFWNNFIIISALFNFSFVIGTMVMFAILLITVSMLFELYIMRDLKITKSAEEQIEDISQYNLAFFAAILGVILLSFFDPLWFVL